MKRVRTAPTTPSSAASGGEIQKLAKQKLDALLRPTVTGRALDSTLALVGKPTFLKFNLAWLSWWLIVNCGLLPGVAPFDPFPFRLLCLVAPTEALLLVFLVALSHRRKRQRERKLAQLWKLIDERREEKTDD